MDFADLKSAYQLIAELLLHPDDRNEATVESLRGELVDAPSAIGGPIAKFLADADSQCRDEYVQTLELSPPCPLYLGAYLFSEPATCRGIGGHHNHR